MRITFVLPYAGLQGGVRVIGVYAKRLTERGHQVFLLSHPEVIRLRHTVKSLLVGDGFPGRSPSFLDGIGVEHRVLDAVRPVTDDDVPDADVVIATYYTTAQGVLDLSPRKGAKAIFIQNYEVAPGQTNRALDASWRMPLHKILISRWLVDLAASRFGDTAVSHVPNSVDTDLFHAPPRGRQPRPTVGMLYSTFELKGCRCTLRALTKVAARSTGLRVVCFGAERPDFRMPLPRFAEFVFRPPQQRLRELYGECDVWACGSKVEGFHLPPIEAMACRCPVVSTRVGGPLDLIEEGVNGHLVDVGDESALIDRIVRVLQLPGAQWKAMSDAAHRTATRYTWDDATSLFEGALRSAIDRTLAKQRSAAQRQPLAIAS